jgi:hypothetical protein
MTSIGRGYPLVAPYNTQLQRAVIRHHVRAASAALPFCARAAHDALVRGR